MHGYVSVAAVEAVSLNIKLKKVHSNMLGGWVCAGFSRFLCDGTTL